MDAAGHEERLAEAMESFLEAARRGESLSPAAYAERYPDCREELLELLPAMVDMEQLSRSAQSKPMPEIRFPESLGGYRLLEKIGSGGMGVVFRAEQESLHREVAVKILSPSWSSDARHCEAFENESRMIAGLRHTNIVEVFGAGQEGGYRYYVMSLVHGQGVSAARISKIFPGVAYEEALARVGLQAAKALAFAHAHAVLHRDVKPGNLLLDDEGLLHVSDFGLATLLNSGEEAPLVTQSHDGTLRYMAPERLNKGINSYAGDQYSLGLSLYELLTRRPAFRETEPGNLIHRICSQPLQPLKGEGELGAIINKCISFAPEDRYASMADVAADLQRYLAGEPVQARPASCLRRYAMWFRRRPAVALWSHAAAILVFLLLMSVSIGYWRVHQSLRRENAQRMLAEKNAAIAGNSMQRIFDGLADPEEDGNLSQAPTQEDFRLMRDLLPYYEELAGQRTAGGEAQVAEACGSLAKMALRMGDAASAEQYLRRALSMYEAWSTESIVLNNALAAALLAQNSAGKRSEAFALLMREAEAPQWKNMDLERRIELLRGLLLLCRRQSPAMDGAMPPKMPASAHEQEQRKAEFAFSRRAEKKAQALALRYLREVLEEQPGDSRLRLLQVQLLSLLRSPEEQRLLAPNGESPLELLAALLEEEPQNERYQLEFVRQLASPRHPQDFAATQRKNPKTGRDKREEPEQREKNEKEDKREEHKEHENHDNAEAHRAFAAGEKRTKMERLRRERLAAEDAEVGAYLPQACRYVQSLLASSPMNSELLMDYLLVRDRYTAMLARQGRQDEARRENERSLGVLSMLSSRADFPTQLRERLVMLTAMHPDNAVDRKQQAEELQLLLSAYDEERRTELRRRWIQMRQIHGMHGPAAPQPRQGEHREARPRRGRGLRQDDQKGKQGPQSGQGSKGQPAAAAGAESKPQ